MRSGLLGAFLVVLGAANFAQAAVNISDKPTKHMSCSAGVCSPTAKRAVLNATDLANMLQVSNVKVITGSGAIMIEIVSGLSWASANRLTLDANCNVSVKAPVTVAGPGGLTIVTNDGGSDCDLLFLPGGKIDFWDLSSSLQINGRSYTLVDDIATLAAAIADDPAGSYALAKDYDASGDGIYGASPISTAFAGSFDGLGHTIANVSIVFEKTATNVGFFEALNTGAIVRDLLLQHISLAPKLHARANLASLAFYNAGSIYNVAVIGSSMKSNPRYYTCSGGLAGLNYGAIERSDVNDTTVLSGGDSGGLACVNFGTISQSRANASVGGGEGAWAGGLAAQNHGTIALSSAAGTAQ